MATALDTKGLRELGAGVLARSAFTAHGASAIFASRLKEVIDELASGRIGEGQARTALWECLKALGYTPEGGFPDAPPGAVPPALRGTLQDLSSFRRLDLIVRTQRALTEGAGSLYRAMLPEQLALYPALELVRMGEVQEARDWPARWALSGGKPAADSYPRNAYQVLGEPTGLIALVGDPVFGELGSYDNFPDALGVDYPPFYFRSEMFWQPKSLEFCLANNITGPNGESIEEFHAGIERPRVMLGQLPLPAPRISLDGVDPEMISRFQADTHGTASPGRPAVVDYSDILEREVADSNAAYQTRGGGR